MLNKQTDHYSISNTVDQKGGSRMNTIAPGVLKELDELIVQLIRDAKEDPTTEKLKALTELLSARANMDY